MSIGAKTVRRLLTAALAIVVTLGGVWVFFEDLSSPVGAVVGTNEQINFQGRLFNNQGAVVPDGYYNIQFKIYQDGTGASAGNPGGTLEWTESFLNNNSQGVLVKNGYMSVELGSVNPFGSQVDWNQSVLWLSMNIGNTNASCASFAACGGDGEMVPMKRLSSSVYAMNANKLGGLTAAGFIQNQNVAAQTTSNFWIDGTGRAATLQASTSVNTPAIRSLTDSTSAIQIQNAAGSTTIMNIDTTNGRVGIGTGASPPTATLQVGGTLTSAGGAISLNDSSNFSVSIGGGSSTGALTIGNSANTTTLGSNTLTVGSATAPTTISKATQTTANTAGSALTISGATGNGTGQGGAVTIQGGNGGASNANGGNLTLTGGTATGTGVNGLVVITTPTFQTTANDASCYTGGALVASTCTIAASSVNNSSAIIVGFSANGQAATLPAPGNATAGRVIYVTAANGSNDFTLRANIGGGTGVEQNIAMRQNTTATMIWNGSQWTAAGASSSTTLQSAYDNTLQSAGGAELVVSKTSATNGLTIRDSSTAPVNGTLLSVQASSASSLLSVNSNVTEYAANPGAETAGGTSTSFPSSTWTAIGGSISRYITAGNNIATGQGSVEVATFATANHGVKNQLVNSAGSPTALTANTTYSVSFAARQATASQPFNDMNVYYSVDGTAASTACTTTAVAITSAWSKVNCTFTTPSAGLSSSNAILIRQTAGISRTFYIDNLSVTIAANYNFATDSGADNTGSFSTNWSYSTGTGTGTVTQNLSDGFTASSSAQVQITAGAANAGLRNKLGSNPLANTLYRVSVYAKATASFNDFKIRYSRDGGTSFVDCVDYNSQAVSTSWSKITCYIKTDGTAASNPYVYFVETASATRTYMVDEFNMSLRDLVTPNVQVGGGNNGGPTTLFTLDKGSAAPIADDNDALLGSMYYDTTLGKLQCYEADGWGACGSSPDNIITISPEYTNAVFHGPSGGTAGIGTMTSDICSSVLNFNNGTGGSDTVCGSNETYNFYRWTSPQTTNQTYAIYVTYQLPSTFKGFASGQTYVMGRTDNGPSGGAASISYKVYRNWSGGLTSCGPSVPISSGTSSSWSTATATGTADPSTCGFAPGDKIMFEIDMTTNKDAKAYAGNLGFTFSNK